VLCEASDVAIYGRDGKRLFVIRNAKEVDLHGLSGMYIAQIYGLETRQLEGTRLLVRN
jgi:uncharacterized protein (UPF0276 family)